MSRQSISINDANEAWAQSLIAAGEYGSYSELMNDLMRQARAQQEKESRRLDPVWLESVIKESRDSVRAHGYSTKTKEDIMNNVRKRLQNDKNKSL